MIVTTIADPSRRNDSAARWRCLARRGMLYSECEAVEHWTLAPHSELGLRGREGVESAWFVLDGAGTTSDGMRLQPGDLVLAPASSAVRLEAGGEGLELLWLAVYPDAVTKALPVRRPAVR